MPRTVTALAALFFFHRVRTKAKRSDKDAADDATPPIARTNWLFLLRGGVFLIVVTALLNWLGFLAAGPVTIAGFMLMMEERRPLHIGVTAIGASIAIWFFFWQLLRFPLP